MEAINRPFFSNDLITFVFLFGVVLIFLMKVYMPKNLLGYTIAFFTQGFMEDRSERNTSIFSVFYGLLFLFSTLVIATTLFKITTPFFVKIKPIDLIYLYGYTTIYFALKFVTNFSLIYLFDLKEKLNYLVNTKNGYLYSSCLLIFPVLIIDEYLTKSNYLLIGFITLILVFRAFLILRNNKKLIFNHLFYFILYFCALELAPLLILYKTIN